MVCKSSAKVVTNFDNAAMLHILKKLGYTYCGEVYLAGGERKLSKNFFNHKI